MRTAASLLLLALLLGTPIGAEEEVAAASHSCPSDVDTCLDWMAAHYVNRGWAGVQLDDSDYKITEIFPGSPADHADVRVGDRLVAINGVEIAEENQQKLVAMQGEMKPGAKFTYTLKRDGKRHNVDFTLVEMPFEVVAQMVGTHLLIGHTDLDFSARE